MTRFYFRFSEVYHTDALPVQKARFGKTHGLCAIGDLSPIASDPTLRLGFGRPVRRDPFCNTIRTPQHPRSKPDILLG